MTYRPGPEDSGRAFRIVLWLLWENLIENEPRGEEPYREGRRLLLCARGPGRTFADSLRKSE